MNWARILALVTGMVDKELLTRNEYLVAENRILKAQLKGRLKLSDAERAALAEIGHGLGRVFRAYRAIHRQSWLKTFAGFGTALAGIVILIVYVSTPMHHVLYTAFGK
jgi:hypothetical protein